jgi:hypothetical protein
MNKIKDHTGIKTSCVVAIDPAKVSGYAIWTIDGLVEWGTLTEGMEGKPFKSNGGLLLIEDQYYDNKKHNFASTKKIVQRKERFKIRAEDRGYTVIDVYPKTWQTKIGIPPYAGWKRPAVKSASLRYAEHVINSKLSELDQDSADAICLGETFIKTWRVNFIKED